MKPFVKLTLIENNKDSRPPLSLELQHLFVMQYCGRGGFVGR